MENNKNLDTQPLLKELDKLIDIVGNNCGPLLIKELEDRLDKVINTFNRDLKGLLKDSFSAYQNKVDRCKKVIIDKKNTNDDIDNYEKEDSSPLFIQTYEEKLGKKL